MMLNIGKLHKSIKKIVAYSESYKIRWKKSYYENSIPPNKLFLILEINYNIKPHRSAPICDREIKILYRNNIFYASFGYDEKEDCYIKSM